MTTGTDVAKAAHHAAEAERLLAVRRGLIMNLIRAQAHASLAVYYATRDSGSYR